MDALNLELPSLSHYQTFSFAGESLERRQQVLAVAQKVQHPFYFYDLDLLSKHVRFLQQEARGILKLWYATKSNPLSRVLQIMHQQELCFDVASPGELAQVMRQGIRGENILCTGPAKSRELIRRYLLAGLRTFVVESHNQMRWLEAEAAQLELSPQVLLRLQIAWSGSESSVLGGSAVTPFGLEAKEWQQLRLSDYPHLQVVGVHTFQWGNILCEEKLQGIWDFAARECLALARSLDFPLQVLDLGGGIGIPYYGQSKTMNWVQLVGMIAELKKRYVIPAVWLELGRFAVGEYGGYVTKVIDKKRVRDKHIVVLDSGMNQMARPTLTGQSFPVEALVARTKEEESYQIHGPLCTALDGLGTFDLPADLAIGDWLLFKNCGAYGFTESMPYFLCHSLPGEAVIEGEKITMVRMPRPANHYLV